MPKFISTQSIVLELPLIVDHRPLRGQEVHASLLEGAVVAGGFFVAATAARQGIAVCVASPLGTGQNSVQARHSLGREGIAVLTGEVVGDIGLRIALIDQDGVRSSVLTSGVESEPELYELEKLQVGENDWILVNLNDLSVPQTGQIMSQWVSTLPASSRLTVAGGPLIGEVDLDVLVKVLNRANLLTLNEHQAQAASSRLGRGAASEVLRHYLPPDALLVLRDGKAGAYVQATATDTLQLVPAFPVEVKDTTGAGDAHTAVLIASLMRGLSAGEAVQRANAAASLALTRRGYYQVPTATQIDDFIRVQGAGSPRK